MGDETKTKQKYRKNSGYRNFRHKWMWPGTEKKKPDARLPMVRDELLCTSTVFMGCIFVYAPEVRAAHKENTPGRCTCCPYYYVIGPFRGEERKENKIIITWRQLWVRVDGGEHPVRINLNVFRTKDKFIFAFFFQYNSPRRISQTQSCRVQNVCVCIERKSRLIFPSKQKFFFYLRKTQCLRAL